MINSMVDWHLHTEPHQVVLMYWLPYIRKRWLVGPMKHTGWFTIEAELEYV